METSMPLMQWVTATNQRWSKTTNKACTHLVTDRWQHGHVGAGRHTCSLWCLLDQIGLELAVIRPPVDKDVRADLKGT